MQLRQHDQPRRAGRLHIIAGIHQAQADASGDGRDDVAIDEVELVGLYRALVLRHGALVLLDQELLVGDLLLRDQVLPAERLIPLEIGFGLFQKTLVVCEGPLGRVQGGLIGARIDLREEVAFLNDLALLEADRQQLPVDLGLHGDRRERRHGSQRGNHVVDVAGADLRGADLLRLLRGLARSGSAGLEQAPRPEPQQKQDYEGERGPEARLFAGRRRRRLIGGGDSTGGGGSDSGGRIDAAFAPSDHFIHEPISFVDPSSRPLDKRGGSTCVTSRRYGDVGTI